MIGAGYAIVDENVDFFEKHAPKFNAAIHSGEITTEGDAGYDVNKWADDLGKLEADVKGHGWQAVRQEMLKRKPYLDDLADRNSKFQSRVRVESDAHLDAGDACESLAIHEAAPIMDQDTKIEQEFYSLVERAEKPTREDTARMDAIGDEQSAIGSRLSAFSDHWRAKGCK